MSAIRPYEPSDRDAVVRIWQEIGWIDDSERQTHGFHTLVSSGDGLVGEVGGAVECFVHRLPGRIRYLDADLTLTVINAVTTSRVARRSGLASAMTARLLTDAAAEGAEVAVLGMFDQGFYDRLGFGTGTYEHRFRFDPSSLTVPIPDRQPVRLSPDDAAEIHALLVEAERTHGGVVFDDVVSIDADLRWLDKLVALGLRDEAGRLTAVLVGEAPESSRAEISLLVGSTPDDVLDLLGVIRSLSDQWVTVDLTEPAAVQLQDLMDRPMRQGTTRRHAHQTPFHTARAWWQLRILDLAAAISNVRWCDEPLRFILRLSDPLDDRAEASAPGLSGDWIVHLGPESTAERGTDADLPVLSCGIGSLSRLWLGVRPATVLARSTDLTGSDDLLGRLDRGMALPVPNPNLYF